jgi:hypothetical protein
LLGEEQEMTREEAIKELQKSHDMMRSYDVDESESRLMTALNMAIQALSQEPSREFEDYENEIEDLHNRLDIAEYDKERLREEATNLEAKIKELSQEPCDDAISRQAVIDMIEGFIADATSHGISPRLDPYYVMNGIKALPPVTQKSKTGHCKNCKYFEYDSVAKVDGIPLIVAHEICNKWGNGCKTSEDGYCYMFESKESEVRNDT